MSNERRKPPRPEYTRNPEKDESPLVTEARIATWLLFQFTPEQLKSLLEYTSGLRLPNPQSVVGGDESWEKAMIRLADNRNGIIVGLDLDHPGMEWEDFQWENIQVIPRIAEDQENLDLTMVNNNSSDKLVEIKLQNIYRDEETETIADVRIPKNDRINGLIPLPTLAKDVQSVLMYAREIKR